MAVIPVGVTLGHDLAAINHQCGPRMPGPSFGVGLGEDVVHRTLEHISVNLRGKFGLGYRVAGGPGNLIEDPLADREMRALVGHAVRLR